MIKDKGMEKLYTEALQATEELLENYSGLEVAAVLNTISMTIYRTVLSEEDYVMIVKTIAENHMIIKPLEKADTVH